MSFIVGIDIGGTFTDCVAIDSSGVTTSVKVPSTPPNFEVGFQNALVAIAAENGLAIEEFLRSIDHVLHGTTVATNIMVQRSGAKVGMLTTKGHRDVTLIMKGHGRVAGLPSSDLTHPQRTDKPVPLVPRRLIREIDERIDVAGEVVVPIDLEAVRREGLALVEQGCEAIAICFLWSFSNNSHEQAAKHALEEVLPEGFPIICSAEVVSRWGEYERFMACVLSAYLAPETDRYLDRLRQGLKELTEEILIIQCTGGITPISQVSRSAAFLIGSGPVGGMNGSESLAKRHGVTSLVCTDMGGTSFDVGLIHEGRSLRTRKAVLDQFEYLVPAIDVRSIGSGGGSIIWVDPTSNTMRVGPRSAGSYPGPPCYGRGGTEPTITDANALIGFIDPDYFLGGKLTLDLDLARKAMQPVADALGMTVEEAAAGAIHIVENQMAQLLQKMTLEQGHDPRDFTALAYGGAASLHAAAYSRALGISDLIVPGANIASVWSAYGIGSSDPGMVRETSVLLVEPFSADDVLTPIVSLRDQMLADLEGQGWNPDEAVFDISLDMKYKGQLHVIEVPLFLEHPKGAAITIDLERIYFEFERLYSQKYGQGTGFRQVGFAIDTIRLHSKVPIRTPAPTLDLDAPVASSHKGERDVYWPHLREKHSVPVHNGLFARTVEGPAIVEFPFTSIVLRHGDELNMTRFGDARITLHY